MLLTSHESPLGGSYSLVHRSGCPKGRKAVEGCDDDAWPCKTCDPHLTEGD